MADLITALPQQFLDEFEADILGRVPQEKIRIQLKQEKTARIMAAAGSVQLKEGLGQLITKMDARLYHRLRLAHAQSADDTDWIDDVLKDNPMLCAPGYKPRRKGDYRHGITYIGGTPVGEGPHSERQK